MPPCSGQSRPSPAGGREDAASLDRPCARRLRELAVGMEEYSRRGSNQRMRPKRARKPTISNRWFSGNFRLALTQGRTQLRSIEAAVVVDPALNVRVVHLGQFRQGFVATMMKRPLPDRPADGRQRLRAGGRLEAVRAE